MCARGLLGKSEVVYTVLLGQRRCLGSVDRVFLRCGRTLEKASMSCSKLLVGKPEDKDAGKTQ